MVIRGFINTYSTSHKESTKDDFRIADYSGLSRGRSNRDTKLDQFDE